MAIPPPPTRAPSKPREPSSAEVLSQNSELIDCLFLVMNGIPFDVAFSLDDDMRLAWVVIIGQLKGMKYNWDRRTWESPT